MVKVNDLRELLKSNIATKSREEVYYDFLPSLYLDFDKKCLYSLYTEPASFEDFTPKNWQGMYTDFLNLIDHKNRFWCEGNNVIFDFNKGDGNNER